MAENIYGFIDNGDVVMAPKKFGCDGSCCSSTDGKLTEITKDAPVDLDTFKEVADKINEIIKRMNEMDKNVEDMTQYAKKSDLCAYLSREEATAFITNAEMQKAILDLNISDYATKEELAEAVSSIAGVDFSTFETLAHAEETYAKKEEIEDTVKYEHFGEGRKTIQLANYDSISGVSTAGTGHNLVMLSKWDVADFGAVGVHLNLNSKDTPTINDKDNIATETFVEDKIKEVVGVAPEALDTLGEIAEKLNGNDDAIEAINGVLEGKANVSDVYTKEEMDSALALKQDVGDYAEKAYVDEKVEGSVKYQDFERNGEKRKTIQLANYDNISGIATNGTGHNLVMLSKWDVADFGAPGVHLNLNSKDVPTLNDKEEIATVPVVEEKISTALESKQDKGNYISYVDQDGRKVVTLNNADIIGSVANEGELESKYETSGWLSLIQLNKWNVVDLGSPRALTNINTPDNVRPTVQEASQSGLEAHKIAYLDDVVKATDEAEALKATLKTMEDKFAMLSSKYEALSKTNVETVADFVGGDDLNDAAKDYVVKGADMTVPTAIVGKSVEMKGAKMVPASAMRSAAKRSPLSIKANDVKVDGLEVTGQFNTELNSNAVVAVNDAEFVEVKDAVFDGTNFYNGIEIGLNSTVAPKNVIFDNCKFMNHFTHNAFSVFRMQDDAVITLNNCYFEDIVGVMRISNYGKNKNLTININNCVMNKVENNIGLILFQDNNGTKEEFYTNNNFGDGKVTININNLIANGEKVTDITLVGAGANPCAINVYGAKGVGYVAYTEENKKYFPTVNIQ